MAKATATFKKVNPVDKVTLVLDATEASFLESLLSALITDYTHPNEDIRTALSALNLPSYRTSFDVIKLK